MKIINSVILGIFAVLFLSTGCKKDATNKKTESYKCVSCITMPEAKSANDASSKGIYKGIVIGSTGTIKFDVQNDGSEIKAYLVIDGISLELTSEVTWNGTQSYTAPFTGTLNGETVTIHFSVGMNGSDPTVTSSNIPGHANAQFKIAKEASNALIECYEGTYHTTKPEDGTFNLLLSRAVNRWTAIARKNAETETDDLDGTIVNNNLIDSDGTNVGTLSEDEINGSFKDSDGKTVTLTGKRTL
jgi:hypothetical protein